MGCAQPHCSLSQTKKKIITTDFIFLCLWQVSYSAHPSPDPGYTPKAGEVFPVCNSVHCSLVVCWWSFWRLNLLDRPPQVSS